ncbi:MAG: zeta toxin family protein [Elusimicrobia bacterium]|nr:zeta toxin family protein [Elusimicrobiota bacterium]
MKNNPVVYVIAGANGAGKTTFALKFLPEIATTEFVNADLIASGVSPLDPESAMTQAGKLFLNRIQDLIQKRKSFSFETTLSGRSYLRLFKALRKLNYKLFLFFLWVPNVELSLKRIDERVKKGGHNVPEQVVRRRFKKGLNHLFGIYKELFDSILILDNSTEYPELVALIAKGKAEIFNHKLFNVIRTNGEVNLR